MVHLPNIGAEDNEHEVFCDVVLDLGLQESLSWKKDWSGKVHPISLLFCQFWKELFLKVACHLRRPWSRSLIWTRQCSLWEFSIWNWKVRGLPTYLSCLMPVPPVLGGPQRSTNLSACKRARDQDQETIESCKRSEWKSWTLFRTAGNQDEDHDNYREVITLFFAAVISGLSLSSCLTTSNSPLNRGSFSMSIL